MMIIADLEQQVAFEELPYSYCKIAWLRWKPKIPCQHTIYASLGTNFTGTDISDFAPLLDYGILKKVVGISEKHSNKCLVCMRYKPTSPKWTVRNLLNSKEMKFIELVGIDWDVSKTVSNIYYGAYRR